MLRAMNNVFYSTCFLGSVFHLFSTKNMPVSLLSIRLLHCAACHWDCFDHGGFAVLRGNTESQLSTVRFGAHQEHFQFLEPFGNHWALQASFFGLANSQCWAMRSGPWIFPHFLVHISVFLPITLDCEIMVWLALDEFFGPLFNNIMFH